MKFLLIGEPDNRVAGELTAAGHEVSACPPGSPMTDCAGALIQMGETSEVQVVIWDDGAPARDMAARMNSVSPRPLLACADPSGVPQEHMVGIPLPVDTNMVIAAATIERWHSTVSHSTSSRRPLTRHHRSPASIKRHHPSRSRSL